MATLYKCSPPSQEEVTPADGEKFTLKEMQTYVGGYIEYVSIGDKRLVVNEEGLIHHLPLNPIASAKFGILLVGDVLCASTKEVD